MEAKLLPLKTEYNGTEIEISFGNQKQIISLWDKGDDTISKREIEKRGYTVEEYNDNIMLDNGFGCYTFLQEELSLQDKNFKNKTTYDNAMELLYRLNK